MVEKKTTKVDIWPVISSVMLMLLILIVFFSYQKSKDFKSEMKALKAERDSLQAIFDNRKAQIDSLTKAMGNYPADFDNTSHVEEMNKLKSKYEKRINVIITNDIDDNILFLSDWLSEKDSAKR